MLVVEQPQEERKVHGSGALSHLIRTSLTKYSPDSVEAETITGSGDSNNGCLGQALDKPSLSEISGSLPSLDNALESQRSLTKKLSFLSCFGYGGTPFSNRDSDKYDGSVSACEVGIRPSFYWLDYPTTEEQRLSAEASARWLKSDCQDDALVIESFGGIPGQTFVGVFDGHGPYGRLAAKFVSQHLPRHLIAQPLTFNSRSDKKRMAAIREACLRTDADMRDMKLAGFDCSLSGTTACFAVINGNKMIVANVGDSRCVVARREIDGTLSSTPLTVDAKPDLPSEEKRIQASGGLVRQMLDERGLPCGVSRVFRRGDNILPGLAMSRSIGDAYAHSVGVSAEPLLTSYTLTSNDQFLLFGTDGLWDVMDCSAATDFVERYRCNREAGITCAEALTLEAQERWKEQHDEALVDDISVAILHLTPLPPPERTASIPRPLARAASCNDEANAMASSWQEEPLSETNPSHHSPRRFFEHLWATTTETDTTTHHHQGRRVTSSSEASDEVSALRHTISQPISMRRSLSNSLSSQKELDEGLRPIRKAYPSSGTLRSAGSWDPSSSFMVDPTFSGDDTPRSSENGSQREGQNCEHKLRLGNNLEGKVRRGIPKSLSTGLLSLSSPTQQRTSLDSSSHGEVSRLGSLEEVALALGDRADYAIQEHAAWESP